MTYWEHISSSIHTFTELLANNSKHFPKILNGHLNRQKILNWKWEMLTYTLKQIILPTTILEFTWLVIEDAMEENDLDPSPKEQISFPQYKTLSEIHIHYFSLFFTYTANFQVPPEKPTPIESANFHPKPQSDLSPYYINMKNGSTFSVWSYSRFLTVCFNL